MQEPTAPEMPIRIAPKRFIHFIPGITGTERPKGTLNEALVKARKDDQQNNQPLYHEVHTYDSSVSEKGYDSKHFKTIAAAILGNLKEAKETNGQVDILTTSLGTTDLMQIFKVIETDDPEFFKQPENVRALRLILISPWGLVQGLSEESFSTLRFGELVKQREKIAETFSLVMRFGGLLKEMIIKDGDEMGILSLQMIKPKDIDPAILTSAVTSTYQERAQKIEDQQTVETLDAEGLEEQSKVYVNKLKPADQVKLLGIDSQISSAISLENWKQLKILLKSRGTLLHSYIWNILQGKEIDAVQPVNLSESTRSIGQLAISFFKNAPSIIKSTMTGEVYQKLITLRDAGVSINFFLPEFDQIVLAQDISKFIETSEEEKKPEVRNVLSGTHTSLYSLNLQALIDAIKTLPETAII